MTPGSDPTDRRGSVHRLQAGDGTEVTAAVQEPPERGAAPVLLTHGAGGDRDDAGLVALASGLGERGHLVVRANLPYREAGRPLPPRAERMVAPFAAIAGSARERFAPAEGWLLGGRSYGGRVASMAAADGAVPYASGLLFYSYPLHPPGRPELLRVDHWPRIDVPTLFLQGTHDPFCDLELLREHLGTLGAPPTLHVIEGGDHGLVVPAKRAADGRRHHADEVAAGLVEVVAEWAAALGPTAGDPPGRASAH